MQLLEQGGVKYIHRITWDEKNYICSLLKPIKTYDYVYMSPTAAGTDILAIKAKSIIARYHISDTLPGVLAIQLTPFNSLAERTISDLKFENKELKNFPLNPDFILPSLDNCLSKYLYLCQNPQQYYADPESNCIIYAMSYHIVNRLLAGYGDMCRYRYIPNIQHIRIQDESITSFIELYRSLKADDGTKFLQIGNKYIVTLYAGMLPFNKADRLEINIYDNPIDNKFLCEYIVTKKQFIIDINMFCIKL